MISRCIAVSLIVWCTLSTTYSAAIIPWNEGEGTIGAGGAGGETEGETNERDIATDEPGDPPEYIRNLFQNFTNNNLQESTPMSAPLQYNTIRSFENIAEGGMYYDGIMMFGVHLSLLVERE